MNKKGIFFTFIAVTLIAALIIIFTPSASINIGADKPVVKTRVTTINEFVLDLENSYLETILKVSSHKAILALISYMESNDKFLTDLQSGFSEAVLQGTVNGQEMPIMEGNTINDWLERMANVSRDALNVNGQFTVNKVEIFQLRPWVVNLKLNISFSIVSETSSWDVNDFIANVDLNIQNFNDPYYLINTNGNYISRINKTNVTFDKWDLEKVKVHIRDGTYTHFPNSKAPSFLMRFTNTSLPSNCCGIESLVNPNKLSKPNQVESYTDYLFFNHTLQNQCNKLYNITDSSFESEFPHFKVDFEHLILHNISLEDTKKTCQ